MITFISLLSVIACVALAVRLLVFHQVIAGLTVVGSWQWALLSIPSLIASCLACIPNLSMGDGWRSLAQYFAAVVLLAPPVCTLGARKPGIGAWHWFVVLPMLVVLMWPAMSQVVSSRGTEVVELGVPALVAIGLVMIMSLGTGLGTLMMGPALLYGLAILSCLAPVAGWNTVYPLAAPWLLLLAGKFATEHLLSLKQKIHTSSGISDTVDAAWAFFQCCYGLPWTRRVQDRVNQFAAREKWCVLLTLEGFRRDDQQRADDDSLSLPLESFCWVLQRFASEEWINRAFIRFRPHIQTVGSSSEVEADDAS